MEDIILQTHGISVKYGNFPALDDVSIRLKNKHIYGFIGENGAGKTTLMKVLTGLLYPTSGTFSLFGKNAPSDILKMRRSIGSVIEAPALYPEYSAYRNLELQRILIGNPDKEICGKLLGMVGLAVMFIVFALKKVTSGIAVTVVFSFVSCNILRNFISKSVFRLTCFSLAQTSDNRTLALSAVFAAVIIVISLTATHFVFRKAEIK